MLAGMRVTRTALALAAVLLLAACTSTTAPASSPTPKEEASVEPSPAGATTILDVWTEIGCKEDDPLGTRGILEEGFAGKTPPIVMQGSCTPIDDGGMAFFWQFESPDDAVAFLESDQLEVGATDAVFVDGAVIALATDAATAQLLGDLMEAYAA